MAELKRKKAPSGGELRGVPQGPQLRAKPKAKSKPAPKDKRKEPGVVPPAEEGGIFTEIFKSIMLLETGRKKKIKEVVDDALRGTTGQ